MADHEQKDFAERALAEMKAKHITASGKPSRVWIDYARWALAFDWLLEYPGFDRAPARPHRPRIDGRRSVDAIHSRVSGCRTAFLP